MEIGRAAVANVCPGVGLAVEVVLLVVWHEPGAPAPVRMISPIGRREEGFLAQIERRWKAAEAIVVVVQRQAGLFEIIEAFDAIGRLAGLLHRRQQQGHQDSDDRNHHQQLDEGERAPT